MHSKFFDLYNYFFFIFARFEFAVYFCAFRSVFNQDRISCIVVWFCCSSSSSWQWYEQSIKCALEKQEKDGLNKNILRLSLKRRSKEKKRSRTKHRLERQRRDNVQLWRVIDSAVDVQLAVSACSRVTLILFKRNRMAGWHSKPGFGFGSEFGRTSPDWKRFVLFFVLV